MKFCLRWLLLIFPCFCLAATQPLTAEQSFGLSAKLNPNQVIVLQWQMADGHYLYKQYFNFKIIKPATAKLGTINFPEGITKQDNILGTYQVYKDSLTLIVPVLKANRPVTLQVKYQGCSESGYCYPPITHLVKANFANNTISTDVTAIAATTLSKTDSRISNLLASKNYFVIFFVFLGFGLLLAFTPCVLPMIPILSGIILGHDHHISTGKAFRLSLTYVLSMSITYAIAGIFAGYIGGTLQAIMQKPWVIIVFSILFVIMALSMFGLYNFQLPQSFENKLASISGHQKKGSYIGVAIMGCLATLIISPCVTPALVAAIGYLAQTGDAILGGVALFATGFGMGIPILLIGTSTKLLPKTGHWMVTLKTFLGILLLVVAILMMSRVLTGPVILFLWAMLLIGCAVYLNILTNSSKQGWQKFWRVTGLILLVYGIILIIGAAMGHSDPFKPLASKENNGALHFIEIKKTSSLQHLFALSRIERKPIMLDFYADWCISCKKMDSSTFSDPAVQQALHKFILVRADVTANDNDDKALMTKYNVIAPPTILFFNSGKELTNMRIIGEVNAEQFLQNLSQYKK